MTTFEELQLVLDILKKHDLPVSPILEYSIKEKMEQYLSNNIQIESNSQENKIHSKSMGDFEFDFSNMSVGIVNGKKLPHKAILLLTIIDLIKREQIRENRIELNAQISSAFKDTWALYFTSKIPSVWIPFWYLKSEPFWHFKSVGDESVLEALLTFGGHPSIGQMRSVIKYAFLDDCLFELLKKEDNRNLFTHLLVEAYIE